MGLLTAPPCWTPSRRHNRFKHYPTHYPTEVLNRLRKNLCKETLANGLIPFDGACKRARDKWYSDARFWVPLLAENVTPMGRFWIPGLPIIVQIGRGDDARESDRTCKPTHRRHLFHAFVCTTLRLVHWSRPLAPSPTPSTRLNAHCCRCGCCAF